jgi:hypothetical protein
MSTRPTIPLADFAFRIRSRYQRALDMVLAGEVEGTREGRSWRVFADAADAYVARQAGASTEQAPHVAAA